MSAHLLKKGFTLIELLIVIAVLGILAVAVLSAINPIEQINRSKDTGSRSDAEQLIGGIDRYYASKGYYPWMLTAQTDDVLAWVNITTAAQTFGVAPAQPMLTNLSSGGTAELKSSYVTRITTSDALYIYNRGNPGDTIYVCFLPQSGSFREEAWTRCKAGLPGDGPALACPAAGTCVTAATADAATGCYSCLP